MNDKGQLSIIAALLVAVILITTVAATYSLIRDNPVQGQPQIKSALDETDLAIRQILCSAVSYYGSILEVTGNSTYARTNATVYLQSGLTQITNIHPEWASTVTLKSVNLYANWYSSGSYSGGNLSVTYNLTGLGITGMSYSTSCELSVGIANSANNQAILNVTEDTGQPLVNLGKHNFLFFTYQNSTSSWQMNSSTAEPTAYANGTYQIVPPNGVNVNSYLVQVQDQRGIMVIASSYSSYIMNMTWSSIVSSYYYVHGLSDVDGYGDTGTHSNFAAQQSGPDNINDTLTEADVPVILGDATQYVQSNSSQFDTDVGGTSNFLTENSTDGIFDTLTEANTSVTPCIPITFTNNQSSATPNPFQEKITWNPSSYTSYEASDLGNIRFYSDSALTQPLYAWLESCTPSLSNKATSATAWIKLTSPITANGGTLTIYMAFLSTNTTYDGNYWGDAPNLSSKYGQYDNGANVFTQYGGASWSSFTTVEGNWDTSNGYLEQTATTGNYVGGPAALIEGSSYSVSSSYVLETAVSYTAEATARVGIIADASLISGDPYGYRFIGQQGGNGAGFVSFLNDWVAWVVNSAYQGTVSTPYTLQVVDNAGTWSGTLYSGYGISGAALTTLAATSYTAANDNGATTGYVGVSAAYYTGSYVVANPAQFQWFRMRQMPPSNVMPSASFGSIFSTPNYQLDLERQWTSAPCNANGTKLLCIKTGSFSDNETLEVDVRSGSSWTVLSNGLVATAWNNISLSTYLTSANFSMRFIDTLRTGDTVQSTWQIDSVLLHVCNATDNYRLDLEEQWINANYTGVNKELDLFMGPFSSPAENLSVQWWNTSSSSWLTLNSSLVANSWNNISAIAYVSSQNFTVRFIEGAASGDPVQSSWQIDAALLQIDSTLSFSSMPDTVTIELMQNGTMRWLGQSLQLAAPGGQPFPPVPTKDIHVNQTVNGTSSEMPFQIEDWASNYRVPLGLTSNASLFNYGNMLVFLANGNVSKVTVWWNGSDMATQTPFACTNTCFNDNPSSGVLNNSRMTLQIPSSFVLTSTVGNSSCTASFMRVNGQNSIYGSNTALVVTNGTVRDIIHQEAEWSSGIPSCPNVYSDIVLTLPANATYYTYQLSLIFINSTQSRSITDLCPIMLTTTLTVQTQTENGTTPSLPIVVNGTGLFYNYTTTWQHHWSQFISGTAGAGIMFTDNSNQGLYTFDTAGSETGTLAVSAAVNTIQSLPVDMSQVSFTNPLFVVWNGAVATFSGNTPIYNNSDQSGLWTLVEYPPTAAVSTGS